MLGLPIYFNYLEELFHNTAVDGSTSTIAGFTRDDALGDEQDGDLENEVTEEMETPRSTTSSRKRSFSTAYTASSPSKGLHIPKRLPVASVMQGLVDQL
jgi:hypothetical protein